MAITFGEGITIGQGISLGIVIIDTSQELTTEDGTTLLTTETDIDLVTEN